MKSKRDIILVLSDQHNGFYTSLNAEMDDITPNLKHIAESGMQFTNTYCTAPLCVPSRMSFLQGVLPSKTGIFENESTLGGDAVTLAHKMGIEGYETILVGRMHFKGLEQFHGFDERYVGDITNQYWGMSRDELGEFHASFGSKHCQDIIGEGTSPVLEYDKQVFESAIRILKDPQRTKPLFMVVGFYIPHYPYVSETNIEDFESTVTTSEMEIEPLKLYEKFQQETNYEIVQSINNIYKKMIVTLDKYVGELHKVVSKRKNDPIFIYTSDHGDQLGKRMIFGKRTLYEDSIKVPLVIHGLETKIIEENVSLIDLHHMILDVGKGDSIQTKYGPTKTQSIFETNGRAIWSEAVIDGANKLINIDNELFLYNVKEDPNEEKNIISSNPKILRELKSLLIGEEEVKKLIEHYYERKEENKILKQHGEIKKISYNEDYEIKDKFIIQKEFKYKRKV